MTASWQKLHAMGMVHSPKQKDVSESNAGQRTGQSRKDPTGIGFDLKKFCRHRQVSWLSDPRHGDCSDAGIRVSGGRIRHRDPCAGHIADGPHSGCPALPRSAP